MCGRHPCVAHGDSSKKLVGITGTWVPLDRLWVLVYVGLELEVVAGLVWWVWGIAGLGNFLFGQVLVCSLGCVYRLMGGRCRWCLVLVLVLV